MSRSPIRWPLSAVLITYAGFTALLWRRIGYPAKARISVLVLLSLIALSAWWLGSVDASGGVAVMSLSAPRLAGLALVAGFGLAAWMLASIPWLTRPGRVAVAVLALYGALPFLAGFVNSAPFNTVATGATMPAWLPRWLNGPLLGIYVLLPVGVFTGIYHLARFRHTSPSTQLRRWGFAGAAVALCFLLVVPDGVRRAGPAHTSTLGIRTAGPNVLSIPSATELRGARALRLSQVTPVTLPPEDLIRNAEAIFDRLPVVRYDLEARTASLGAGIGPSLAFVRDHIRYEAYPGTLRGAEGTLTAGAGNAADRSLLLAALLKAKGFQTRFAMGRLTRDRAEALMARIFAPERPEVDATGAPPPAVDELILRLRARALRDFAVIRQVLGTALPPRANLTRERVLTEIEPHVWVQVDDGGTWRDVDSAFADAAPGKAYASAERVSDTLPHELAQRVTIRLLTESLAGDALQTHTALEFTAPAPDVLDRQIFLLFGRDPSLAGGVAGGISGGEMWTPILWVDGDVHEGREISFAYADRPGESPRRGGPPRGGLGDVLGPGGALSSGSQFVAVWLEFEIAFPDGTRDTTRRAIVDRAGPAWRAAAKADPAALKAVPLDAEGLLAPRTVHNIWLSAGRHNLAALATAARVLAELAAMRLPDPPPPDLLFGELLWPFAMQNLAMLVYSDHVIVPGLNDGPGHRFYADSPRISTISVGPDTRAGDDGVSLRIDLLRDHVRGLAREPGAETGVLERRLWFGALEGALEHEIAARYAVSLGGDPAAVRSTSGVLEDGDAVVLRPGDAPPATSADTAAGIARALAAGSVLVIPRRALQAGPPAWWEILPGSGDVRAVYDDANAAGSFGNGSKIRVNQISQEAFDKMPGIEDLQKAMDRANAIKPKPSPGPLKPNGAKGTKAKRARGVPEYLAMIGLGTVLAFVVHKILVKWVRHGTTQAANDTREAVQSGQTADRARR